MKKAVVLRDMISQTGLSIRKFSEKADIPYTTLHSMLDRGVGKASVDNVIKICKALGITAEYLDDIAEGRLNDDPKELNTIGAHHDGEEWTAEELAELESFKQYVLSKRKK